MRSFHEDGHRGTWLNLPSLFPIEESDIILALGILCCTTLGFAVTRAVIKIIELLVR